MKIREMLSLIRKIDEYYSDKLTAGEKLPSGRLGMRIRAIWSFVVYGTSFSEYFGYSFYRKTRKDKLTYMTRRHMFRFFDKYNAPEYRDRMGDKSKMAEYYGQFMAREQFIYSQGRAAFDEFCEKHPRIFVKKAVGWGGEGARIEDADTPEKRAAVWNTLSDAWVVEPVIENCGELKKLYPGSLNTLKVVTVRTNTGPEIVTAIFRMGNNTVVDNVHLGGMCAGINIADGRIITPAIDRHFRQFSSHPITHEKILGITLPYWDEVKRMALEAAEVTPQVRYTSWDIAITPTGPVLMEGNWDAEFYAEQELFDCGNRFMFTELLERK